MQETLTGFILSLMRLLLLTLLCSGLAHAQLRALPMPAGTVRTVDVQVSPGDLDPDCTLTVVTQPGLKMNRTTLTRHDPPRVLPSNQGDGVMLVLHCKLASAVITLRPTAPTLISFDEAETRWDSFLGYRPRLSVRVR